ncbi:MAG: HupE/UreJ family protein [Gammaproteobacteria bacterium]|nr:HupE/UreJ family protein [Gammaproteobacteria bacterium]
MPAVQAHKLSDSYLTIDLRGSENHQSSWSLRWDVSLLDLDAELSLDHNLDRQLTWGELRLHQTAIVAYLQSRLSIESDNRLCQLQVVAYQLEEHSDGPYLSLSFLPSCDAPKNSFLVNYQLFFDQNPTHRGLLNLLTERDSQLYLFSPNNARQRLSPQLEYSWLTQVKAYFPEGVWHIWIGYDHLLFLFTLILPVVARIRTAAKDQAHSTVHFFIDTIKIVTAFTVAHSITLVSTSMQWLVLPGNWVEMAIAASITVAALHNIRPILPGSRWSIAFILGLIHGFGFANVLLDLGAEGSSFIGALLGFNLGIEFGQLWVVVGVFVLFMLLARLSLLSQKIVPIGSSLAAVMGVYWLVQRI